MQSQQSLPKAWSPPSEVQSQRTHSGLSTWDSEFGAFQRGLVRRFQDATSVHTEHLSSYFELIFGIDSKIAEQLRSLAGSRAASTLKLLSLLGR